MHKIKFLVFGKPESNEVKRISEEIFVPKREEN